MLQAPSTCTWLNPGESITLTTSNDTPTCDGKYLIAPHPEAKGSTQEWISTGTHEIKNGSVTITNDSAIIQKVSAKDSVAQSFAMVDPDLINEPDSTPATKKAEKEPDLIKIDPSALLPSEIRHQFSDIFKEFGKVFGPDLPKYNGAFGKVKAAINIPNTLPPSARLKEVPWYPKTLLVELKQKFD